MNGEDQDNQTIEGAPGWNEMLASESEASVRSWNTEDCSLMSRSKLREKIYLTSRWKSCRKRVSRYFSRDGERKLM